MSENPTAYAHMIHTFEKKLRYFRENPTNVSVETSRIVRRIIADLETLRRRGL